MATTQEEFAVCAGGAPEQGPERPAPTRFVRQWNFGVPVVVREGQMNPGAAAARSRLVWIAGVLAAITGLSILAIDVPVAIALTRVPETVRETASRFTGVIEVVFGFPLSIYATGVLVLALAGVLAVRRASRSTACVLCWIALIQLTTRFTVDVLKPIFDRLRPNQAMINGALHDHFFAGVGNSFPSGHAAHFWGFFFSLAILFPKWSVPLLVVPVLVSLARVIANDHYVSDVLASAAVAALITLVCFGRLTARRADPSKA